MTTFDTELNKHVSHNHNEYVTRREMQAALTSLSKQIGDLQRQMMPQTSSMPMLTPKVSKPKIKKSKIKDFGTFDQTPKDWGNLYKITDAGTF